MRWVAWLLPFMLVLSACASTSNSPSYSAPSSNSSTSPTVAPTVAAIPVTGSEASLSVANDPTLGQILVGSNGMTLYVFEKDTPDKSNCTAACLQTWPPLKTQGSPQLGTGVDSSLIGSATLADGSKVVTINHMPLYYFSKDAKPGDTKGQGIGGVWSAVSPDGKPVGMQSGAGSAPTPAPTQGSGGGGSYQNSY